jgi:hypothetical protein
MGMPQRINARAAGASFDGSWQEQSNMKLVERVSHLESDLTAMRSDVSVLKTDMSVLKTDVAALTIDMAVVKSDYATTSDVLEAKNSVIVWVVSAVFIAQLLPGFLKKFGL